MKNITKILWGVVLVALGVIFSLNALGLTDVNVFFKGWWTLFIIIPSIVGLFTERDKFGNFITLSVGVLLLLASRDIIKFSVIWKLVVPILIIIFGVKLIFGGFRSKKFEKGFKNALNGSSADCDAFVIFGGKDLSFDGLVFSGSNLNAVFGGIECDLSNAVILSDCAVKAVAVFGGVDITFPPNVNVKVSSNAFFGGVSDETKKRNIDGAPTVYVDATCVFGGIDLK